MSQWSIFVLSACAYWLTGNVAPSRKVLKVLASMVVSIGALLLVSWVLPGAGFAGRHFLLGSTVFRIWAVALAASLGLFHDGLDRRLRVLAVLGAILFVFAARQHGAGWQSGWLPPLVVLVAVVALRIGRGITRLAVVAAVPAFAVLAIVILPRVAAADLWSFRTRFIAWRGLLDLMEGRWLLGLGLASYWHYWQGVLGSMAYLDPETGYLHYTYDPQVNMHNNYIDVFGQMGVVGLVVLGWLLYALVRQIRRQHRLEPSGFGRAYVMACAAGLAGMAFSGMLADWIFPFVYNIGLDGFRDSFIGWMFLGGLIALDATRVTGSSDEETRAQLSPP